MKRQARKDWAQLVAEAIYNLYQPSETKFIILAGKLYCRDLVKLLNEKGFITELPLKSKGIGQQLQWLGRAIQSIGKEP